MWYPGADWKRVKDKRRTAGAVIRSMLNRLDSMITISGLPETIPERDVKRELLVTGNAIFAEVDGDLYRLHGTLGGPLGLDGRPVVAEVTSVPMMYSATLKILNALPGTQPIPANTGGAVVVWCTPSGDGVYDVLNRAACLLAEITLSIRTELILRRGMLNFTATDSGAAESINEYLHKLAGGDLAAIWAGEQNPFFGDNPTGILTPTASRSYLPELLSAYQFTLAEMLNDLGLDESPQLKSQYVSTAETEQQRRGITPLCETILRSWNEGFEAVNRHFGTGITADFGSAWNLESLHLQAETALEEIRVENPGEIEENTEPQEEVKQDEEETEPAT